MLQVLRREPGFYRRLWALALPIVLQYLITFSLGLMDTFMVGQLGNMEMAAVTTANTPAFILMGFVFGVQSGLGVLVGQYWGKGDMKSISRAVGVAAMLGTASAVILATAFFFFPVQIMDLMSNNHELSVLGAPYLRLIGISYVFNMISSVYGSALRSMERPGFGTKLFGFSTILNTVLNYLLIFGKFGFPAMGVVGAAVATVLARAVELLICIVHALRGSVLRIDWAAFFCPGLEMVGRFVKYSSPVIFNEIMWGLGNSLFTVILGHTANSVEMLAANAVMANVNRVMLVICYGIGVAAAVIVGKAIGEGQSREEVQSLSRTLLVFTLVVSSIIMLVALGLVPTLFISVLFPLFKLHGAAAAVATALAVTCFLGMPPHAFCITAVNGVLRGGGDVAWGSVLDLSPLWLVAVPLTALAALVFDCGGWVIGIAMQMECLIKMPLCWLRLRGGKWIHDVTVSKESQEAV